MGLARAQLVATNWAFFFGTDAFWDSKQMTLVAGSDPPNTLPSARCSAGLLLALDHHSPGMSLPAGVLVLLELFALPQNPCRLVVFWLATIAATMTHFYTVFYALGTFVALAVLLGDRDTQELLGARIGLLQRDRQPCGDVA